MFWEDRESFLWAAGLLEGEGSFMLSRGQRPELRCSMTDEDVVRRLHRVLGMGHVYGPNRRTLNGVRHKDQWAYSVQGQYEAYALMVALYPFMGCRRKAQIERAIKGWISYRSAFVDLRRGEHNNRATLTNEQADYIRSRYNGTRWGKGEQAAVAAELGVSTATIYNVSKGITYATK